MRMICLYGFAFVARYTRCIWYFDYGQGMTVLDSVQMNDEIADVHSLFDRSYGPSPKWCEIGPPCTPQCHRGAFDHHGYVRVFSDLDDGWLAQTGSSIYETWPDIEYHEKGNHRAGLDKTRAVPWISTGAIMSIIRR